MGIPAFYRWLTEKYPRAVVDVVEEAPVGVNGVRVPIDSSRPNPNGVEFDNLYLDMNNIIHPCFHPEGLPAPTSYEEVFQAVFKYIDKIFSIVRPRKLLYLAIDGVAPRAKMNQQRSRRFRAAKDAADEALLREKHDGVSGSGEAKSALSEEPNKLDSNVITPGTEFMHLLSSALHYYINLRMTEDSGWHGIKVIFSDASVPGEGEHKIMSYIRLQRNAPGFDPNTRHCMYGLDADLIMLALATHEIHFTVLREDVRNAASNDRASRKRLKRKLIYQKKENKIGKETGKFAENIEDYISGLNFQFLHVWVLREYLAYDMRMADSTLETDLERLIDDFVFMCLFVGNDFLPHIPSLEISEGAIDLLMTIYRKEFIQMGGYLTDSFQINLARVEQFVKSVGSYESAIFRKRSQIKEREIRFQHSGSSRKLSGHHHKQSGAHRSSLEMRKATLQHHMQNARGMEIQGSYQSTSNVTNVVVDKIKLGEEGWKERYYAEKFNAKTEIECEKVRKHMVFKYVEGICWVMRYYYEGVCSWQWFYPYHYAPFASDLYGLGNLEILFTLGEPLKPLDQLMGVLPAASAHALPLCYRKLMMDPSSPILDFYPTDFELDMNGKRFSWQAVCKLPFIEESRLLSEVAKVEHTLTDEERQRNSFGMDILFIHISHPLAVMIMPLFQQKRDAQLLQAEVNQKIDPEISGGMNGYICIADKHVWSMEVYSPINGMQVTADNKVISVFYKCPPFHPHIPRLPKEVILPGKSVGQKDILPSQLWHEKTSISGCVLSKRPIPKSVWGPHLAKMAYRLVSEYYPTKQKHSLGHMEPGACAGADVPEKMGIKVKSRKRKRGKGNKTPNNNRFDEIKKDEVHNVPSNNVEKLESYTPGERGNHSDCVAAVKVTQKNGACAQDFIDKDSERCIVLGQKNGDGNHAVDAEKEKTEVKSKKRKPRSKKRKQGGNVATNDVKQLEMCNNLETLQSSIPGEQKEGHEVQHGANGVLDVTGSASKKKKHKSKKRRRTESDALVKSVPNNEVEKLDSCNDVERPQIGGHFQGILNEQKEDRDVQHSASGVLDIRTGHDGVQDNKVEKLSNHSDVQNSKSDGGDFQGDEQKDGHDAQHGANGIVDIRTGSQSKKRKRKSKKSRQNESDVPVKSVPEDNVEKLQSGGVLNEQKEGNDVRQGADGLPDIRTNLDFKKKKRKSKRRRGIESDALVDSVPNNKVKELDSCKGVEKSQSDRDDFQGVLNELTEGQDVQSDAAWVPDIGVGHDSVPNNKVEKLDNHHDDKKSHGERGEFEGVLNEQKEGLDQLGANGVPNIRAGLESKKRKRRSKKSRPNESDPLVKSVPDDKVQKLDNYNHVGKLQIVAAVNDDKKSHGERGEFEGVVNEQKESLDQLGVNGVPNIRAGLESKKRKRRSKKSRPNESDALVKSVPDDKVQKLDNHNHVGKLQIVAAVNEQKAGHDGQPDHGLPDANGSDALLKHVPENKVEKLQSGGVLNEQKEGGHDVQHGANGALDIKTGLKSKKRKRKSKKNSLNEADALVKSVPGDKVEQLDSRIHDEKLHGEGIVNEQKEGRDIQ